MATQSHTALYKIKSVYVRRKTTEKEREAANHSRATDNNLFNAVTSAGRFLLQSPTVTKALNLCKKIRVQKSLCRLLHADRFSCSHLFEATDIIYQNKTLAE